MGRWKMGPNGGYWDSADSGADQYQPTAGDMASMGPAAGATNPGAGMMTAGGAPVTQGSGPNAPTQPGMIEGPGGMPAGYGPGSGPPPTGTEYAGGPGGRPWMQEGASGPNGEPGIYARNPMGGPSQYATTDQGMPGGENGRGPGGPNGPSMPGMTYADIQKMLQEYYARQGGGGVGRAAANGVVLTPGRMNLGALGGLARR